MQAMLQDVPEIFRRAAELFGDRVALETEEGCFTYAELLARARTVAAYLLAENEDLREARVAFLVPPGIDHVAVQWGIWMAGGIAVPLCQQHPEPELAYVIEDSDATLVVAAPELADRVQRTAEAAGRRFFLTDDLHTARTCEVPQLGEERRMLMVYTSGTTGRPKGVVFTFAMLSAQVKALVDAWGWTKEDVILHVLPLHHVHGIVNVLTCALWSGARCILPRRFDVEEVWQAFLDRDLTVFMAVPTIYSRLIQHWEKADEHRQATLSAACGKFRLMVSGSAALPVPVLNRWQAISGHILLERYGMTEMGMALSNPLIGKREPGKVGKPLPGVAVRLMNEAGEILIEEGVAGEIQVKGSNVFSEYWRRTEETTKSFTADGWFRTGDMAVLEEGSYRILGRNSVDIIKTGGYKVSALEIENALLDHPLIEEVAVVGVDDPEWGESVSAAVKTVDGTHLSLEDLRIWGKEQLAVYKVPTRLMLLPGMPRNAMGKVTKTEIKNLFVQSASKAE
jgi:malonyl-CoA/methylmalonyl-CoA synthetase